MRKETFRNLQKWRIGGWCCILAEKLVVDEGKKMNGCFEKKREKMEKIIFVKRAHVCGT